MQRRPGFAKKCFTISCMKNQQFIHFSKPASGLRRPQPVGSHGLAWRLTAAATMAMMMTGPASSWAAQPALPSLEAGQGKLAAASEDVSRMTKWIRQTSDNKAQAFVIIDKKTARLHVFNRLGSHRASSPVLLGLAVGDESVPGIGARKMADIRPDERTTPAGRFASEPGVNLQGDDIVWIDYEAAVSIHRVRTGHINDRRLQRLATPDVSDNRISYGCVNVPAAFYDQYIKPVFGSAPAVVYVLPETTSVETFFNIAGQAR